MMGRAADHPSPCPQPRRPLQLRRSFLDIGGYDVGDGDEAVGVGAAEVVIQVL